MARHFLKLRVAASSGVNALAHEVNNTTINTYRITLVFIVLSFLKSMNNGIRGQGNSAGLITVQISRSFNVKTLP